jgi:mannose-6-phosphate isomerase-like protein (cupin superfamily)
MNHKKVVEELKKKYPGKKIILIPETEPTEIICEVEPTSEHPEYSVAIAVVDRSAPHYHKIATETYKPIEDTLELIIDGNINRVYPGDTMTIPPGAVHYAAGTESWFECRSEPGWTKEDQVMVEV